MSFINLKTLFEETLVGKTFEVNRKDLPYSKIKLLSISDKGLDNHKKISYNSDITFIVGIGTQPYTMAPKEFFLLVKPNKYINKVMDEVPEYFI